MKHSRMWRSLVVAVFLICTCFLLFSCYGEERDQDLQTSLYTDQNTIDYVEDEAKKENISVESLLEQYGIVETPHLYLHEMKSVICEVAVQPELESENSFLIRLGRDGKNLGQIETIRLTPLLPDLRQKHYVVDYHDVHKEKVDEKDIAEIEMLLDEIRSSDQPIESSIVATDAVYYSLRFDGKTYTTCMEWGNESANKLQKKMEVLCNVPIWQGEPQKAHPYVKDFSKVICELNYSKFDENYNTFEHIYRIGLNDLDRPIAELIKI